MAIKHSKTNALRRLDTLKMPYKIFTYNIDDGKIDGISVCNKIKENPLTFFKTLVTASKQGEIYVFLIPILEELDLKSASQIVSEKSLQLVAVKELLSLTGYHRGGCSPIGMKKDYNIYIDSSLENLSTIIISGGKIGIAIEILVSDFLKVTEAEVGTLTI